MGASSLMKQGGPSVLCRSYIRVTLCKVVLVVCNYIIIHLVMQLLQVKSENNCGVLSTTVCT